MGDPEVVSDDLEPDISTSDEGEEERRSRRRYWPLVVIVLLLLLLCCVVTSVEVFVTGGPQQARFVARNLECLQCHRELIPDFSKPVVHNPFMNKECTLCHTPHGSQVTVTVNTGGTKTWQQYRTYIQWLPLKWWFSLWQGGTGVVKTSDGELVASTTKQVKGGTSELRAPGDKLCYICHGDIGKLLGDDYQHQPFEAGRCMNCHEPHASTHEGLLTQRADRLCFTCHPIGEELSRDQIHPPAGKGWCIDCHNPHASNNKGILVLPQRELCFSCHPSVSMLSGLPVQHQPFLYDNCTGCHEPHGSNYRPLLDAPQPKLCYKCHPGIQDQFLQPSHHPIEVKLVCSDCHQPHAANNPGLLVARDNAMCFQCHSDKEALYDASKHKNKLCIDCHTPHGSANEPLLLKRNPEVCFKCHAPFGETTPGGQNHPVTPNFLDVHANKGLTCSSSCHNPHGTKYNYMLRSFYYAQDGLCLQCHLYVGITY